MGLQKKPPEDGFEGQETNDAVCKVLRGAQRSSNMEPKTPNLLDGRRGANDA